MKEKPLYVLNGRLHRAPEKNLVNKLGAIDTGAAAIETAAAIHMLKVGLRANVLWRPEGRRKSQEALTNLAKSRLRSLQRSMPRLRIKNVTDYIHHKIEVNAFVNLPIRKNRGLPTFDVSPRKRDGLLSIRR